MSDEVIVLQAHDGGWRWKRRDSGNHETLSESSETYTDKSYAVEQAKELNPDCLVTVWE